MTGSEPGAERAETPAPGEGFESRVIAELRWQDGYAIGTRDVVVRERARLEANAWYFILMLAAFCLGFSYVSYVAAVKEARQ